MKKLILFGMLVLGNTAFSQGALGEVVGKITEEKNETGIYGAQVYIMDQDRKYQISTDPDGRFRLSGIPAGKYLMNVKYATDTMSGIEVKIPMDGICNAGTIKFLGGVLILGVVDVKADDGRMKLEYGSLPIKEITAEEIAKSPVKFDIKSLITTSNSDVKMSDDGELMFRGSRKGDMLYLVDGVKGREIGNMPSCAIGRMMVYTGGVPAKYGDTLGGVIVIESKSYFDLYRAWEAEEIRNGNR